MAMTRGYMPFTEAEYRIRLATIKAKMAEEGIDTLMVTVPANITYLTGYTAKSGYVPQGLIVSQKFDQPTFVTRRMDATAAKHQMWIDFDNCIGYPEDLVGNPDRNGNDAIIEFLVEAGLDSGTLALENRFLPWETVDKYRADLPKSKIVDFSNGVTWIRLIKTDAEVAMMRQCAAISDAAMTTAGQVIRPGLREADAAAEIYGTLIRGTGDITATDVAGFYLCASPRHATAHIPWAHDTFGDNSHINLELGGKRFGYCSALMRTFSIGEPSDRLKRVHDGEVEGLEAALAAAKPGATCGDVADAFYAKIAKHGFEKESRCGYAIGIDWLEPTASLKTGDPTVLKPNMTFHLMLGNWMDDDFGYVISETFVVTDKGGDALSKTPREILRIG